MKFVLFVLTIRQHVDRLEPRTEGQRPRLYDYVTIRRTYFSLKEYIISLFSDDNDYDLSSV